METGSTQLIRNTAAQQLADIQKKHPDDLFNLLTRVVPYLKSKSWDTRTAAAKAIGGIVDNVERFDPNPDELSLTLGNGHLKKEEPDIKLDSSSPSQDHLQLATLDVQTILDNGKKLLASAGREYEYFLGQMDPAKRLQHQKQTLTSRLGLGGEYMEDELITENDILKLPTRESPHPTSGLSRLNTQLDRRDSSFEAGDSMATPAGETPIGEKELSKRQLNSLKRKRKREALATSKVQVTDLSSRRKSSFVDSPVDVPKPMAIKKEEHVDENGVDEKTDDYFSLDRTGGDDESKLVSEFKGAAAPVKSELQPETNEEGVEWPFERLCEYLMVDMFDFNWEIRHGAAMGLREILRVHGFGAGRERGKSKQMNDAINHKWLDDLACRVCCVFMLDRFGDYVSDNVITPVRETAGQTLGSLLQHTAPSTVEAVYNVLRTLVLQENMGEHKRVWQACHGGMIGMRYLVAVRHDVLLSDQNLMDGVLSVVMKGLGDFDDDVRSVSAATLIPVCEEFVTLNPSALGDLVSIVWDCLSNLSDDLSASTGSVMDLLSKLCSYPQVLDVMKINAERNEEQSFTRLVPRLFPFLRHTITGVRLAVLRALRKFLEIQGEGIRRWITSKALRLIFQNVVVERNDEVRKMSLDVWFALLDAVQGQDHVKLETDFLEHLAPSINITLHPIGLSNMPLPMEASNFIRPSGQVFVLSNYTTSKSSPKQENEPPSKKRRRSGKAEKEPVPTPVSSHNIDGPMITGDVSLVGVEPMIRSRVAAARALARLISIWPSNSIATSFTNRLMDGLRSRHSSTKLFTCTVIEESAKLRGPNDPFTSGFAPMLHSIAQEESIPWYTDIVSLLQAIRHQCQGMLTKLRDKGGAKINVPHVPPMVQGDEMAGPHAFSFQDAERIVGIDYDKILAKLPKLQRMQVEDDEMRGICKELSLNVSNARDVKEQRDTRVKAAAAAAIVALNDIPQKPNDVIGGIMNSVKREENFDLQKRSADSVVSLLQQMVALKRKAVIKKVGGNLVKFYTSETAETPEFMRNADIEDGILSLRKDEDVQDHKDPAQYERDAKAARLTRRGAKETVDQLALAFGERLFDEVPILKVLITEPLQEAFPSDLPASVSKETSISGQEAVDAMSTIRALVEKLHPNLYGSVLELLPFVIRALKCKLAVLRYMAAKCIATVCSMIRIEGFEALVKQVLPSINNALEVHHRQGAIECVYHLINVMGDSILPYVIFLIVPVLGRMSDSDNSVRLIATTAFATLVKLVPLEAGVPDPPGMSQDLLEGRERERNFMSQMLDPKKIEHFKIPVAIKAELRSYQQDGVNWLNFLNRYNLHGILCDDMGLGKTLQTLCVVASDHHQRVEEYEQTQDSDKRPLPTIIVCPPTLSGHWQQEIRTYAPFLTSAAYVGPPAERSLVRDRLSSVDIVITSYEVCRNDIEVLAPLNWNYCVLDEGHLIKNPQAKTTQAVKRLNSYHRLILSGTPIQNNVLELWSLFDFLMPGFLGTEKIFKDRFAKPIALSRFGKSSSKEQEAGALALESLHKQVLPFLMRRLKEEVLNDLPPKILQNYYCDLSDLQRKLFEDFTKKEGKQLGVMAQQGDKESKQHIFTALNYMRKLCNSPSLVMTEKHKHYAATQEYLARRGSSLSDPQHAPKLVALRDLLVDCGIGAADVPSANAGGVAPKGDDQYAAAAGSDAVAPHRALIFCQMKEMLDIVAGFIKKTLPSASSLRLDGSVPASQRQNIVNTFNSDPSIDLLLLTTSVGGLGLNLTGADTVIFVEHDWNPQKDIQAMDRAHRIGQKRTVNVYRLVTRGTLEEKILNLQRFKVDVASQVVQQQKAGLAGMDTGEILDLFNMEGVGGVADAEQKRGGAEGENAVDEVTGEVKEKGQRGFLDDLGELWDEGQYEEEFNMDEFLGRMKG